MRHLTDEQIQLILDNESSSAGAVRHVNDCDLCRHELQAYRRLYRGLRQDSVAGLRPGFAESVVARVAVSQPTAPRISDNVGRLLMVGPVLAIVVAFYYLNLVLGNLVGSAYTAAVQFTQQLSTTTMAGMSGMNVSFALLLSVALILASFATVDKILRWSRGRHFCL